VFANGLLRQEELAEVMEDAKIMPSVLQVEVSVVSVYFV